MFPWGSRLIWSDNSISILQPKMCFFFWMAEPDVIAKKTLQERHPSIHRYFLTDGMMGLSICCLTQYCILSVLQTNPLEPEAHSLIWYTAQSSVHLCDPHPPCTPGIYIHMVAIQKQNRISLKNCSFLLFCTQCKYFMHWHKMNPLQSTSETDQSWKHKESQSKLMYRRAFCLHLCKQKALSGIF